MRYFLKLLPIFLFCTFYGQKISALDSLKLKDTKDIFADDYGNIYLSKNNDFSVTKYDSVGELKGKLLLTLPFKIQSVQNLLNLPTFSENAQELKFFDQNFVEIQTINFRQKFGFIKMAFAEDLQQIWLMDESTKRLIQYNFREDQILNSYPLDIDFEGIKDILVYKNILYLLNEKNLSSFDFKGNKLLEIPLQNGKRLRRENRFILVIGTNYIQKLENLELQDFFHDDALEIVDKNSSTIFGIKDNKLYLYPIESKN